ncbi:helix-turn-helix transcriptional regulator [Streptomyces sp. ODS28]|uniref:helix-turn-helix domain-containing protein n=1 Tax=Streptomyces sp. ODS28 TaxID=3136688 RepID=UPI0031EBE906
MANIKKLDPGASPLHYFGAELRWWRERAGLLLDDLGKRVFLTGSMIGQIETAAKVPRDDLVPRLDEAVGADGALIRAWEPAKRCRLPIWYQPVAQLEASAREIRLFQSQLVHGLFQTESYARAVLGVSHQGDALEALLEARMERQHILERKEAPHLWLVLDESVLCREVGGKQVMKEQLHRLLDLQETAGVQVQVLPFGLGEHTGLSGSFELFLRDDQADVAYLEDYEGGDSTADPDQFRNLARRYDLLRADALSPRETATLIARVLKERYDDHRKLVPRPVA